MKKLLLSTVFVLLLVGCQTSDQTRAKNVAIDYLKAFYDTTSYEGEFTYDKATINELGLSKIDAVDDYITEEFKEELMNNRLTNVLYDLTFVTKSCITVSDIELSLNTEKEDYYSFNYVIGVRFVEYDKEYFDIQGQIKVDKIGEDFYIDAASDRIVTQEMLEMLND